MTKKETAKFVIQVIVSIASAILTALGATSCIIDISIGKQQPQYTLLQIGSLALTLQMPDCLNNYY